MRVAPVEVGQAVELALLFLVGGTRQLELVLHRIAMRVAEGVDTHDRQFASVFLHLVMHRFVLDAAALVTGFHGESSKVSVMSIPISTDAQRLKLETSIKTAKLISLCQSCAALKRISFIFPLQVAHTRSSQ